MLPYSEEYQLTKCLQCGSEDVGTDDKHCMKCGAPVVNQCTVSGCRKVIPVRAEHCPHCGGGGTIMGHLRKKLKEGKSGY